MIGASQLDDFRQEFEKKRYCVKSLKPAIIATILAKSPSNLIVGLLSEMSFSTESF
jgi:hypothetical protein